MLKLINKNVSNIKDIIKLKYSEDINEINHIPYNILYLSFEFSNKDIFLKILTNEYQPLTFIYYSKLIREYIENYNVNENKYKSKYNELKLINNSLYIGDYIILPISKGYGKNGVLSPLYYYYYDIRNNLPNNTNICIIQPIGPWEIKNNTLNLFFELDDILSIYNNCNVFSIFILIDYGENIKYNNIKINSNSTSNKKEYIIININDINEFDNIDNFLKNKNITDFIVADISYNEYCYNELMSLPLFIVLYNKLLNNLEKNGNIYMYNRKMNIYIPKIKFLNLLYLMFSEIIYYDNIFIVEHLGFYKFSNYNNKNYLLDIVSQCMDNDKYLGQNLNFGKNNVDNNLMFCHNKQKTKNPKTYNIIKSIMKYNNNEFLNFIYLVYESKNKSIKNVLSKIETIENNKYINIGTILSNNISKSIEFCNKNNIEINDIYKDFKVLNYKKIIYKFFPKTRYINKIQLSIDSCYSITLPEDTIKIIKYIKKDFPLVEYIIDGTSNVGSTSIIMSMYFKFLYAFEINEITYNKLKNNVKLYNLKNIYVINYDIVQFMNDIEKLNVIKYNINNFCLFLDPPWEGVFYKAYSQMDLKLGDIDILDFIKNINIKYLVIKVPFNYNFSKLFNYFNNVIIHKMSSFYTIYIEKT